VERLIHKPLKKIVHKIGGLSMSLAVSQKNRNFYNKVYNQHRTPHFFKPYNKNRNVLVTNANVVKKLVRKNIPRGYIKNMVDPIGGKGGFSPMYIHKALANNPSAYAIIMKNPLKLRAFSLFKRNKNVYINVISARPTYGGPLLKKIIHNNPNRNIRLGAVNDPRLLQFYEKHGFVRSGPAGNLVPMTRVANRQLLLAQVVDGAR